MFSFRDAFAKDLTAADVHASSAGTKKKPLMFGDALQRQKLPAVDKIAEAIEVLAKAGARHSKSDLALLQTVHDHACALGASCNADNVDEAVGKGDADWSIPFTVAKADADQQLIFGWASVVEKDGKLIIDKQGDMILPEDLEKAAYDFNLFARQHGDMHTQVGTGRLVESMVFTKEKQAVLGIDLGKVGWWTGFKVDDRALWDAHKRGERPEFSIGGTGRRAEV